MSAKVMDIEVGSKTPMLELVPYEARLKKDWDACVRSSRQPHCFFERDFIEYHGNRFHETSLMLKKRGKFLAVLPLAKVEQGIHSYPGLPFCGWIASPQMTLAQFSSAFDLLADWMVSHNAASLIYHVSSPPYRKHGGEEDIYELERRGAIPLPHKITSLRKIAAGQTVNRTVARMAQVALRDGLKVDVHHPLIEIYQLVCDLLGRRHQSRPLHQFSELEYLSARFPELIKSIGVTFNGTLVAGAIFLVHGDIIRLQYVGYREDCPPGASELQYVHIINDLRHHGMWLDFGTSMDPDTGNLMPGLLGYKESYGARMSILRSYQWMPEKERHADE